MTVDDVVAYLTEEGIVDGSSSSTGWPSSKRRVHDQTQQLVIVTEDGGAPPEIGRIDDSAALESPGVQVRVRGEPWDGDAVAAKMAEVYAALHGLTGATLGSTFYVGIVALTSSPASFYDEKGRVNQTMSFALTRPAVAVT